MPEHTPAGGPLYADSRGDTHGNRTYKPRQTPVTPPDVRKVPADSVPYGTDICRRGSSVWCSYDGRTLIGVYATADEARRAWRTYKARGAER